MTFLVTGGAGFIGSNFVLDWFASPQTQAEAVVTLDALTYAGNPENLAVLQDDARHTLAQGDICNWALLTSAHSLYKTTEAYEKDCERAILWSDPPLSIDWPFGVVRSTPNLPAKDATAPCLEEVLCA